MEEIGATDGTTFLIRQLFYNIPCQKKILKNSDDGKPVMSMMY